MTVRKYMILSQTDLVLCRTAYEIARPTIMTLDVPKELEANGIKKEYVKFSKAALECIVENYTRESGVRELEKKINKVIDVYKRQFQNRPDGNNPKHNL